MANKFLFMPPTLVALAMPLGIYLKGTSLLMICLMLSEILIVLRSSFAK